MADFLGALNTFKKKHLEKKKTFVNVLPAMRQWKALFEA